MRFAITVLALALTIPAAAQEKRTVALQNATMAYVEAGAPDDPPVLFVHGLPFSSYIWRDVMAGLDGQNRRLIAVDLVGFGDSAGDGFGITEQAAHLTQFVDAMGLSDITLVGHDWGAGIALMFAAENPDKVAAFATLEGAMPPVYPRPAYEAMPERVGNMFRAMREGEAAERNVLEENFWLETIMPTMTAEPLADDARAEYLRPFPTPESRAPLLAMSRSLPIGGKPEDAVAAYTTAVDWWLETPIPKLVITAQPGRLFPAAMAQWTSQNAANVTVTDIGPGIHALQEEAPAAVAAAIAAWLKTLAP